MDADGETDRRPLKNVHVLSDLPPSVSQTLRRPQALIAQLSPLGWDHINLTGDYVWSDALMLDADGCMPLRLFVAAARALCGGGLVVDIACLPLRCLRRLRWIIAAGASRHDRSPTTCASNSQKSLRRGD